MSKVLDYEIPSEGSLGLMALGWPGIESWRCKRDGIKQPDFSGFKSAGGKKKFLLIGWDAADWKIINPLLEQGKMPTLKKLMESGVSGNIATLDPPLSPMLWTSIATGKYADKHGILGFTEPDPTLGQVRPVSSTSRKVKAIWNILNQQSYKNHVVGWWPSHPAEPINGICISNHFQRAHQSIDKIWPVTQGMVHPFDLAGIFARLRVHPDELTEAHILPFIPDAAKIDQEKENGIGILSRILSDCITVHNCVTWIMENREWDFMAVYHDAIDHFSHSFMKFHPPRLPVIPEESFEIYRNVIDGAYIFHDMMLERLMGLASDDTTILLLSDHGFKSDHQRPLSIPDEPAGPAIEHRQFGIFCLKGPGIKKNEKIYGSTLLDVTPTILSVFGLPVGKDMDGTPLLQAFENPGEITEIDSWELVEGDFGMFHEKFREDPFIAKQALDQLINLGYIQEIGDDNAKSLKITETERQYNLARVYISSERSHLARPLLEKLFSETAEKRFGLRLAWLYRNAGEVEKSKDILNQLKEKLEKSDPALDILEISILIDEKNEKPALEKLEEIRKKNEIIPDIYIYAGRCYLSLDQFQSAESAFLHALVLDPDKAVAHYGLGVSYLRQNRYEEGAEALLNSLDLVYQFPVAHYHLGECLFHLGKAEDAARCFEVALVMSPGMSKAKIWLEKIYKGSPVDDLKSKLRRQEDFRLFNRMEVLIDKKENIKPFNRKIKGEMVIVSGLPRSGTSMMMEMLEKGGLEIFTDKKRSADDSNPGGYYEHDAIKNTARDKRWLKSAVNKTAKVIAQLLPFLPPNYKYKIIFMQRSLQEIMMSQHKMMVKNKKAREGDYQAGIEITFRRALERASEWVSAHPNAEILYLNYSDVINSPENTVISISKFLGKDLDHDKMIQVVKSDLYRNRT